MSSSTWTRAEPHPGSWSRSKPTSGAGLYGRAEPTSGAGLYSRTEPTTGGWNPTAEPTTGGFRGTDYGRAPGQRDSVQPTEQRYFDAAYPAPSAQPMQRTSYPRYGATDLDSPRPKDVITTRPGWEDGVVGEQPVGGYLPAAMAALAWYGCSPRST